MGSDGEVVLAVFRAVEERDGARLFELYHDDVEFVEAESLPYGGVARGRAALQAQLETDPGSTWLGTWGALQPTEAERRMNPRIVAEHGGAVVVEYRQRALAPHGERFEAPVVGLYEVRDGRFAKARMFHLDTAAILRFLRDASG